MEKYKIYVASSWKNEYQPKVIEELRKVGLHPYDFREPGSSFSWKDLDPNFHSWSFIDYMKNLSTDVASRGFDRDYNAMESAELFVLVLPCGRSAHLEAGWAIGNGKPVIVYMPEKQEPDLMYLLANLITNDFQEMIDACKNRFYL